MLLRHSFGRKEEAAKVERAVRSVLAAGKRTADIFQASGPHPAQEKVGTAAMGDAVVAALR